MYFYVIMISLYMRVICKTHLVFLNFWRFYLTLSNIENCWCTNEHAYAFKSVASCTHCWPSRILKKSETLEDLFCVPYFFIFFFKFYLFIYFFSFEKGNSKYINSTFKKTDQIMNIVTHASERLYIISCFY